MSKSISEIPPYAQVTLAQYSTAAIDSPEGETFVLPEGAIMSVCDDQPHRPYWTKALIVSPDVPHSGEEVWIAHPYHVTID